MPRSEFTAKVSSAIGNQTLDWSEYTGDVFFKVAEVRGANIIIKDDQSNYVAVVSLVGHNMECDGRFDKEYREQVIGRK